MSKLNAAAKEWTPPASTGLRSTAQAFVPTSIPVSQPTTVPSPAAAAYSQYSHYYGGYPPYGYDSYGYPIQPMGMVYDPTVGMVPVAIPAPHYEGHKSRSNSLTHHDAPHSNNKYPAVPPPAVASSAPIPTPAASSNPSTKVEEPAPEIEVPEASSSTAVAAPAADATAVDTVPTENTVPPAIASEGKIEQEGWARGKALIVEQPIERQNLENPNNPEAGPSPWKRGISMSEKTPAQMLLRQDGIIRYSRETIITLHILGSHPVPSEIFGLYGVKYTANERVECKPLTVNSVAAKSPNKGGRRDGGKGGRHNELIDEPHPDEKTFFVEKNENAFRHDPNRVLEAADAVMQKAIAILNKLSVETFDKLSDQFLNIGMETEAIMCRVVDLIVSKAQMEEHFCFMYADLCKKITEKWVSEDLTEDTQQPSPEEVAATSGLPDLGKAFRLRLLTRCQEEFQQDREAAIQAVLALEIPEDEKEEKLFVLKKRYTGHMRFIGEIYMKDLLKPSRVLSSIEELLNSRDEEKLSCLMKLLQTVGKKLEAYDVKKKKNRVIKYFEAIQQMSTDNSLSTKIRFGFKDLMEMRANNWTARRVEEKAKKLSEIRASSGVGSGPVSSGSQGPSSGTQMRGGPGSASSRHPQVNDARAMPAAAPAAAPGADDWSVVTGARNKKGGSSSRTPAGPARGAVLSKPTPTPTTNKFGALANQSAQSQRSGGKSKTRSPRDDDDEETSGPQVQIPQSSSLSAFSPNGESTLGEEMLMSPTARGADGVFDEAMTTRIIATMNEYFLNDLLDEAVEVMKETVHPNAGAEAIRILIRTVLEKKDSERNKFNIFLPALFASGLFGQEQFLGGISAFLHDFDDIVVDVPLVGDYVASILAALAQASAIDDLSFALHLPDENNFSLSMNQYSLIVKTATFLRTLLDDEEAVKKFFYASVEVPSLSELSSMDKEQVEKAIEKTHSTFLL